jgi:protein-S-isoprenylcysteine O-methyltransferase Ste14
MTPLIAKLVWRAGVIGWYVIRYPYARRSRRIPSLVRRNPKLESLLLLISAIGLGIIPAVYVMSGLPRAADYHFREWQGWLGMFVFGMALVLFRLSHKQLGRNWSVTLEVRDQHALVTKGVYSRIRHPMYAAFWLWAFAQALLLPNWFAGGAGIVGFGMLFFVRVGAEETLMLEKFGDAYHQYMKHTWRILPGIY